MANAKIDIDLGVNIGDVSSSLKQFDNSLKPIVGSAKNAQNALTSLSLVAQDLPFGFIGIQNNLPRVIQTFGELKTQTGGTIPAIKELGKSLIGPAGLFLAFSTVTAAITFAVQEYGSLGNAINALINGNKNLAKELGKINKEYEDYKKNIDDIELSIKNFESSQAGQISTIEILTKQVNNLSLSESQRSNALNELKKIDKDYYGGFTIAKQDSEKLKKATDDLTQSIINQAKAKGLSDTISEITKQISNLEFAQKKLQPQFKKLSDAATPELERIQDATNFGLFTTPSIQNIIKTFQLNNVRDALRQGDENINTELERLSNTKTELEKVLNDITGAVIPDPFKEGKNKDSQLRINAEYLDTTYNPERTIAKLQEFGNIVLNTNKNLKDRKSALEEVIGVDNEFFKNLVLGSTSLEDIKAQIEDYIFKIRAQILEDKRAARALELNTQFKKNEEEQTKKLNDQLKEQFDNTVKLTMANDQFGNTTVSNTKKWNTFLNQLAYLQDISAGVLEILNKDFTKPIDDSIKNLLNYEEYVNKFTENVSRQFRFLQNPLENLFGTLLDGAAANWKEFADNIINEIKRITAALVAKALITGLANLLAPGLGSLVSGGLKRLSTEALGDYLGETGGAANFGGLQPAGLSMGGQVNVVLRGSDLVGALNRTNTNISRIG